MCFRCGHGYPDAGRSGVLRERDHGVVVQAHGHAVGLTDHRIAFHSVARHGTGHRTANGGHGIAASATHLMTEQAAHHAAKHCAHTGGLPAHRHRVDALDHAIAIVGRCLIGRLAATRIRGIVRLRLRIHRRRGRPLRRIRLRRARIVAAVVAVVGVVVPAGVAAGVRRSAVGRAAIVVAVCTAAGRITGAIARTVAGVRRRDTTGQTCCCRCHCRQCHPPPCATGAYPLVRCLHD